MWFSVLGLFSCQISRVPVHFLIFSSIQLSLRAESNKQITKPLEANYELWYQGMQIKLDLLDNSHVETLQRPICMNKILMIVMQFQF